MKELKNKLYINSRVLFYLKRLVFLCPVFVFLFFHTVKRNMSLAAYHSHVLESGILEITTEINYLICFFISCFICNFFRKKQDKLLTWLYFLLSLGMLFIFLEEISYGQRLFELDVPRYFEKHNRQDEINFHNLVGFGVTKSMWIFKLFIGVYGTFSLFIATKFVSEKYAEIASWICPQYILIPCFSTIIIQYVFVNWAVGKSEINNIMDGIFRHFHGHEITELILSFGFLFFLIINAYRVQSISNNRTAANAHKT